LVLRALGRSVAAWGGNTLHSDHALKT
jgi:hypothetical protein